MVERQLQTKDETIGLLNKRKCAYVLGVALGGVGQVGSLVSAETCTHEAMIHRAHSEGRQRDFKAAEDLRIKIQ